MQRFSDDEDGEEDDEAEERQYSKKLLRAYAQVFPAARVSLEAFPTRRGWAPEEAARATASLASVPIIDHCLHRGSKASRTTCIPHLVLDCSEAGFFDALPEEAVERILEGQKLSQRQKAVLGLLSDVPQRVAFTVAYACNRCFSEGYPRAVVLLFFQTPGGGGHANMLLLEARGGVVRVTCYEPNGSDAAAAYGTVERFFPDFEAVLEPLVGRRVGFAVAGLALQTFLGSRRVRRRRAAVVVAHRGYPVCEAAVLWFFASYVEAGAPPDLAAFEAALLRDGRRELKAQLLDWILDLEAWVRRRYAREMRALLDRVFAASNVTLVRLQYGRIAVRWGGAA